ncbi:hypothetical protein C9J85_19760 [Haloferax sp. wsp5]|nr:hypothetical protein C9J85_19760 [Haloferax sp. wsp5]
MSSSSLSGDSERGHRSEASRVPRSSSGPVETRLEPGLDERRISRGNSGRRIELAERTQSGTTVTALDPSLPSPPDVSVL